MNQQVKQQIREALKTYCERFPSQNKAANSLKNVSSATISQILNDKWDLIADEMWRRVAAQIGYSNEGWVLVPTTVSNTLYELLADAQATEQGESEVHAIVGHAGCGKTATPPKIATLIIWYVPSIGIEKPFYWNLWRLWGWTRLAIRLTKWCATL